MAHETPDSEPNLPATTSPARAVRQDGWTPARQAEFLRVLAVSQNVAVAARSVGMTRQSAYKLRARCDNGPFGAGWRAAISGAHDTLVEAALDRAIHGVEVQHYWQGELVGTSRRYDERLTTALLSSGVLTRSRRQRAVAEEEYAACDFATLLERIEHGPAEWQSAFEERGFASGDDMSDLEQADETDQLTEEESWEGDPGEEEA